MDTLVIERDPRQQIEINTSGNVKIPYKGYMISLSTDSSSTMVHLPNFMPGFEELITSPSDVGGQIKKAIKIIDKLTKKKTSLQF